MKKIKSPLRYPGGKSRATDLILTYIPSNVQTVCSPFFGGGSIELALSHRGVQVYGYDAYEPLVNFWKFAINQPQELSDLAKKYLPVSSHDFKELKKVALHSEDDIERAAAFYVVNRASFSGTTLVGGMSVGHPRFNKSALEYLYNFKLENVSVDWSSYVDTIEKHKEHFLYLDPPYVGHDYLYSANGSVLKAAFDHEGLSKMLKQREQWVLSYGDCDLVRDLYRGFKMVQPQWSYSMNKSKKSNELLILSQDL